MFRIGSLDHGAAARVGGEDRGQAVQGPAREDVEGTADDEAVLVLGQGDGPHLVVGLRREGQQRAGEVDRGHPGARDAGRLGELPADVDRVGADRQRPHPAGERRRHEGRVQRAGRRVERGEAAAGHAVDRVEVARQVQPPARLVDLQPEDGVADLLAGVALAAEVVPVVRLGGGGDRRREVQQLAGLDVEGQDVVARHLVGAGRRPGGTGRREVPGGPGDAVDDLEGVDDPVDLRGGQGLRGHRRRERPALGPVARSGRGGRRRQPQPEDQARGRRRGRRTTPRDHLPSVTLRGSRVHGAAT